MKKIDKEYIIGLSDVCVNVVLSVLLWVWWMVWSVFGENVCVEM